jgi:ABC-type transport system substrate-binding protein
MVNWVGGIGIRHVGAALCCAAWLAGCNNNPWPEGSASTNTLFSGIIETTPRHLDPVSSYWSNDTPYTYQIYEPPYGYHYLKRPIQLVPKSATVVAKPRFIDKNGNALPDDAPPEQIAESIYDVPIKKGILYQPHPAFAKDAQGKYLYHTDHPQQPGWLGNRATPVDFEQSGTRELVAEDFVYTLKRHVHPRLHAPVGSVFADLVIGLKEFGEKVKVEDEKLLAGHDPASLDKPFLDLRQWPLAGASAPEKHLLRIRIKGKYPQWGYWMQMTFTAPVPWEADAFYAQPGMAQRGMTLDRWPVGTGPYMMTEYIQDRRITIVRNPNYRREPYPCEGAPGDQEAGLLADCGKPTPFIDRMVFTADREGTSLKNKFRQGYYDIEVYERSDTGKDYLIDMMDSERVNAEYTEKGFQLKPFSDVNSYYIAFNMLDPTLGYGQTPEQDERNRKLRQAISIAIDWEEYSKTFPRKSGDAAMSPLPPGIFGSREGQAGFFNPVTHRLVNGKVERRPIEDAKRLLAEAGYPDGRDAKTGKPLVINYDFYAPPTPARKPEIDWVVRQFAKIDIQLEVRATDNPQFQDKAKKGSYQVFWLGWNADYPDAENFLFLLYGPNGKTKYQGENYSNYASPAYDKLFERIKSLDDGDEKQRLIDEAVKIAQQDAAWTMGYFPHASAASQRWVKNLKYALLIRDTGRYLQLDTADRAAAIRAWNRPVWWPLWLLVAALLGVAWFAWHNLRRRDRMNARGETLPERGQPAVAASGRSG